MKRKTFASTSPRASRWLGRRSSQQVLRLFGLLILLAGSATAALTWNGTLNLSPFATAKVEAAKTESQPQSKTRAVRAGMRTPTAVLQSPTGCNPRPTGDPGGFEVEGNLAVDSVGQSDWATVPYTSVSDKYDDATDDVFAGGDKFNDDPNTWGAGTQNAQGKTDIGNVLYHSSTATNGDTWFKVAVDRLKTDGESYMDFELFQQPVTLSAGVFASAGTHGGRTVGDILLTVGFNNSGAPVFLLSRWEALSGGGYDYVNVTSSLAAGTYCIAANSAQVNGVSYQPFGSSSYAAYQFVEAALNVSQVLAGIGDPCRGFVSLLVKSKASTSPSAQLKDLLAPVQLDLSTGPVVKVEGAEICEGGSTTLTANVTGGAAPYSIVWTLPPSLTPIGTGPTLTVSPTTTTTYQVAVTDKNNCVLPASTKTVTVTVNPLPKVTIDPVGSLCVDAAAVTLSATPAGGTFSGLGVVNGKFDPVVAGVGKFTLEYTYTDGKGCINSATTEVIVNALPTVKIDPVAALCVDAKTVTLTASPTGGTFSGPGVTGDQFDPATAGVGTHTIKYTYKDENSCVNSTTTQITVNALPVVKIEAVAPLCVDAAAVTLVASPTGGTFSGPGVTGDQFNPATAGVGMHTIKYTYKDENSCVNSTTTKITVNALPAVKIEPVAPLCVDAAAVTLVASPTGGTFSGPGVTGDQFNPATAGVGTHTIKYTYKDENSCVNSTTTQITVNALPVVKITGLTEICSGASVTLNAGAGYASYLWSNGATTQSITVTPAATTTYSVTVKNVTGCAATTSLTVKTIDCLPGFCSYTQGGWGATPQGNNPARLLSNNFTAVFSSGIEVGIPGVKSMRFLSARAVDAYLPAGGTPGVLTGLLVNPATSSAGVFGGQVLALKINVAMSDAGKTGFGYGTLIYLGAGSLQNMTVRQILAAAETALGGGAVPAGYTIATLNDLATKLNEAFDNCQSTAWAIANLKRP